MRKGELSTTQKAAIEKIKGLMREYALATRPSFLYTQKELLNAIENDLSRLDEEYISKYKIPKDMVDTLAKEIYDMLMGKGEYERAIAISEHYKL